jgi:hypothetical protein
MSFSVSSFLAVHSASAALLLFRILCRRHQRDGGPEREMTPMTTTMKLLVLFYFPSASSSSF